MILRTIGIKYPNGYIKNDLVFSFLPTWVELNDARCLIWLQWYNCRLEHHNNKWVVIKKYIKE